MAIEFLRFGSQIPGSYHGCCDVDIIQSFSCDPQDKHAIELMHGDSGTSLTNGNGEVLYAGMTNEEVFRDRLRYGTFSNRDMPNHVFLAVLTEGQIGSHIGKKWLKILKEEGFEFLRASDNAVYTGVYVSKDPEKFENTPHTNYIFGLFRNIGMYGSLKNPYLPPSLWTDITVEHQSPEVWQMLPAEKELKKFAVAQRSAQLARWNARGPAKFYTEEELTKKGVTPLSAGRKNSDLFPGPAYYKKSQREKARKDMEDLYHYRAWDKEGKFLAKGFASVVETTEREPTVATAAPAAKTAFRAKKKITTAS